MGVALNTGTIITMFVSKALVPISLDQWSVSGILSPVCLEAMGMQIKEEAMDV